MIDLYPESCVYILRVAETQNHKIGMTRDPEKRIHDWRNMLPFVDLEIVAVYYTSAARALESKLHEYFKDNQIGASEWFELRKDSTEILQKPEDALLEFFGIYEIVDDERESDEGPYSNIMGLPKPKENIAVKIKEPSKKQPDKKSTRLFRVPDGTKIPPDQMPSLEDEFHLGLVPEVKELYEELGTWQAVADHYDVPKEIVWAIGVHKDDPISFMNDIRTKLGLSTLGATHEPMPADLK